MVLSFLRFMDMMDSLLAAGGGCKVVFKGIITLLDSLFLVGTFGFNEIDTFICLFSTFIFA